MQLNAAVYRDKPNQIDLQQSTQVLEVAPPPRGAETARVQEGRRGEKLGRPCDWKQKVGIRGKGIKAQRGGTPGETEEEEAEQRSAVASWDICDSR